VHDRFDIHCRCICEIPLLIEQRATQTVEHRNASTLAPAGTPTLALHPAMRVILNPMARHGAGRRLRPEIERALERAGLAFDVVQTEGPGHAAELARSAAHAGCRTIVAAGGDGTIHEVANGILAAAASPEPALGLIPIGTGNDFVKMIPGTHTREHAVATLARGTTTKYDVGRAQWNGRTEYFMNAMGTGIDVEVVRRMRRVRYVPGGLLYVAALLHALVRYRPAPIRIEIDGEVIEQRIMLLAVANGSCIGGTFRICPGARADDGLLDVCLVDDLPILRNARLISRVIRGTHHGFRGVTSRRGRAVRLSARAAGPLRFQLDGELRETPDAEGGVAVDLLPARLNVIHNGRPAARVHQGVP
jgi:diacylglycerol kinase (ATP)